MRSRFRVLALISTLIPLLGVARLEAAVSVLNGLTHEDTAEMGETYEGEIVIGNSSDLPAQVKVYQTDYTFDASGASHYDAIGSIPRSNGSWVTLGAPGVITIEPKGRAVVPFKVTVPAESALVGTFWSVVMVEAIPSDALHSGVVPERSLGIHSVFRYAVQLITHVGEGGREDFRLTSLRLEAQDEEHLGLLYTDLENTGETLFRAHLRFELFDQDGEAVGVFLSDKKRLYPATSARLSTDLSEVPVGSYKMIMMVRMASGSVYASEYNLGVD